ncbi:MAG: hypothetical protein P8Y47_11980 [Alphaproteobacteria bacterium]
MTARFICKISEYAFRLFLKLSSISQKKRPICASFYIDRVSDEGAVVSELIEARSLGVDGGNVYLYGWVQMVPGYRCIPADNIVTLTDSETREVVTRRDIATWLLNRSVR